MEDPNGDLRDQRPTSVEFLTPEAFAERFPLPEGFLDLPTHRVLVENIRTIMCGKAKDIDQRDFDYADMFMRTLIAPEQPDLNHDKVDALRKERDPDLTAQIQRMLADFSPASVLYDQRTRMGITGPDAEHPYDVVVVQIPKEHARLEDQQSYWRDHTGAPTQFAERGELGKETSTIFIPDFEAQAILDPKSFSQRFLSDMLRHEYRHTQRKVTVAHDRAFLVLDETLTDVTGYIAERGLLQLLCLSTADLKQTDFTRAYEQDDKEKMGELLDTFARDFGPMGLLMYGGQAPTQREGEAHGIPGVPLQKDGIEQEHAQAQFAETLLRCRAEQDPVFLDVFHRNIQDASIPLPRLEVLRHYSLGTLFPRKTTEETLMVKVRAILDEEIDRRKALGEESFYAKS